MVVSGLAIDLATVQATLQCSSTALEALPRRWRLEAVTSQGAASHALLESAWLLRCIEQHALFDRTLAAEAAVCRVLRDMEQQAGVPDNCRQRSRVCGSIVFLTPHLLCGRLLASGRRMHLPLDLHAEDAASVVRGVTGTRPPAR